jgi:hypothetical protein
LQFGACLSRGLQWTDDLDADAHRDNGKHFVVRADEKLTAFMELEGDASRCGQGKTGLCQKHQVALVQSKPASEIFLSKTWEAL